MKRSLLLAFALVACGQINEPGGELRPGLAHIAGYNNGDPIIVIDPAEKAARVRITTYGGGCTAKGDTHVTVAGMVATVSPYNVEPRPRTPCTAILLTFVHDTLISFPQSGTATIRVRGIDIRAGSAPDFRQDTILVVRTTDIR